MLNRFVASCVVAVMCAVPLAALAPSPDRSSLPGDTQSSLVASDVPIAAPLTDADREAFQIAQQASDPRLEDQRGGHGAAIVLAILIIILIFILIDDHVVVVG